MLYRFTGFVSCNGKTFTEKNRILIEANSDEDAKSTAYNKLKKMCGVKPLGQFKVQRMEVERIYSDEEIAQMNYQREVEFNRQNFVEQPTENLDIPFTDFEEEQPVEEVVEETPKKSTRKKKAEQSTEE